ncbi:hypothetical protein JAAARDRAFT_117173 [Jaapia argillacea MUCL 33604]|uniref:Fluoride ion transporter CrcB n=1 Tax=Jaapia argillacea MUCL 33604 TaxID=933084 RepID=A0A067QBX8_9AGAM|nr:hypothetical protein JAAARDRAFT_117173 [Jaapia argillacea MUCL 33604]
MPASVFGVLTRLGLQALATYQGQSIFPLAYAQAFGCFVMGFTLQFKEPIGQFYGPLYTAITTGFCGSVTTFSGWELDVFSSWVNATQAHRGGLRDVVDGLTKTIFTLIISLSSMSFGAHVGSLLRPYAPKRRLPRRPIRYTFSAVAVLIYAATLPAYFRLSADYRHQATAALLFSFPGTLTRYLLSYHLNPRLKRFPLGTYTANSLGTAFLGAFHVLQSVTTPLSLGSCAILQGLADGYCGCLTTVSTFAAEVDASRDASGYFYVALSWGTGQLLLLLILGSSYWAGHISEQVTCRYA